MARVRAMRLTRLAEAWRWPGAAPGLRLALYLALCLALLEAALAHATGAASRL